MNQSIFFSTNPEVCEMDEDEEFGMFKEEANYETRDDDEENNTETEPMHLFQGNIFLARNYISL